MPCCRCSFTVGSFFLFRPAIPLRYFLWRIPICHIPFHAFCPPVVAIRLGPSHPPSPVADTSLLCISNAKPDSVIIKILIIIICGEAKGTERTRIDEEEERKKKEKKGQGSGAGRGSRVPLPRRGLTTCSAPVWARLVGQRAVSKPFTHPPPLRCWEGGRLTEARTPTRLLPVDCQRNEMTDFASLSFSRKTTTTLNKKITLPGLARADAPMSQTGVSP